MIFATKKDGVRQEPGGAAVPAGHAGRAAVIEHIHRCRKESSAQPSGETKDNAFFESIRRTPALKYEERASIVWLTLVLFFFVLGVVCERSTLRLMLPAHFWMANITMLMVVTVVMLHVVGRQTKQQEW